MNAEETKKTIKTPNQLKVFLIKNQILKYKKTDTL